jgi:hypothetical protein
MRALGRLVTLVCVVVAGSCPARAELWLWVDDEGRTHVVDDASKVPSEVAPREAGEPDLDALWGGSVRGPQPPPSHDSSRPEDRAASFLRGALEDLARGELARAATALDAALRLDPRNAEAHWYKALLDRQRGRLDSAQRHLEDFLANAGERHEAWRASAERRLRAVGDERRLAAAQAAEGPLRLAAAESPHFRIHYDQQLGDASPDYARTVARYLEEARTHALNRVGVAPAEPTSVVFYGKAAYLAAHKHRFSFPTVGFYDGRIHVASAAHPAGELRALLFHEYVHAVFAERTGGHRPFWLNEGLAEVAERFARGQEPSTRSERAGLRRRIEAGEWIPLAKLAPGFAGLDETQARLAYSESAAAAAWILARADREKVAALLDRLGEGDDVDSALRATVGVDGPGLEAAVQGELAAEFPPSASRVGGDEGV